MRGDLYREQYPPVGDGTGPNDGDTYEAFLAITELRKQGILVPVKGIVGSAVTSVPLTNGEGYLITIETKEPLDTLTMHGEVMLVGVGGDDG